MDVSDLEEYLPFYPLLFVETCFCLLCISAVDVCVYTDILLKVLGV